MVSLLLALLFLSQVPYELLALVFFFTFRLHFMCVWLYSKQILGGGVSLIFLLLVLPLGFLFTSPCL